MRRIIHCSLSLLWSTEYRSKLHTTYGVEGYELQESRVIQAIRIPQINTKVSCKSTWRNWRSAQQSIDNPRQGMMMACQVVEECPNYQTVCSSVLPSSVSVAGIVSTLPYHLIVGFEALHLGTVMTATAGLPANVPLPPAAVVDEERTRMYGVGQAKSHHKFRR